MVEKTKREYPLVGKTNQNIDVFTSEVESMNRRQDVDSPDLVNTIKVDQKGVAFEFTLHLKGGNC